MHILLADDHAVVRRGLKDILAETLPGLSFSEAGTGDEVLRLLLGATFNLLVLDINMPGRSGLDVLRDVKHAYPRLPVIILSMHPEDQYAVRCLRAGAAAYINKDSAPDELAIATKKILSGGRYVSPRMAEKLVYQFGEPTDRLPHELLSDREHEVMRMIASGVSLTEIGDRLHVSVKTVSTYRARIMEKMRMSSNAEMIRYAMVHQLIE
ncbi:MAG: response regulator transcription factor [Terracidiphilus sp.]|nr:response regulator transcription factor [Terracidiphilus sp.]